MPSQDTARRTNHFVYVAIAADAVIAASKFVAAGVTRSSAMLAEGIHSSIDNLLLLFGIHRARKPAVMLTRKTFRGGAGSQIVWHSVPFLRISDAGWRFSFPCANPT